MIASDTKNWVFSIAEHIYWWNIVGKSGKNTIQMWVKGLSPPPDIMTFPNFLTILTHKFIN